MAASESCEVCGFHWNSISSSEIPVRTTAATEQFVDVVRTSTVPVGTRPSPDRWSILEYGAHMRDVFISIRERIIRASIEDEHVGGQLYRNERVNLGLYALDQPDDVATELHAMSRLFIRPSRPCLLVMRSEPSRTARLPTSRSQFFGRAPRPSTSANTIWVTYARTRDS